MISCGCPGSAGHPASAAEAPTRRRSQASNLLVRLSRALPLLALIVTALSAQHSRIVSGRVVVQRGEDAHPLAGSMVTLHRVGSDTAGAIDSVQSDARGRYRFSFRPSGAEGAVYFAAVLFGGVAYFTAPLGSTATEGESAEITVFDTVSTGIHIGVRGRHVAISAPSTTGNRTVVDVFELGNDSLRTLVAASARAPTWRVLLPEGAVNATVLRDAGDIAAAAVEVADGVAAVVAPFAPGLKQLALRYEMRPAHDSLTIPLVEATGVLEVLLEETEARAFGAGLTAKGPVTVEGKSLQRYVAQDVPASAVLTLVLPESGGVTRGRPWLLALLGAVVAAAISGVLLWRSRGSRPPPNACAGRLNKSQPTLYAK